MSHELKNKTLVIFVVMLVTLALSAGSSLAAEFYLRAEQFTKTMPDGKNITMWGFAPDSDASFAAPTTATVPGPALSIDTNDPNIVIHLKNNLPKPVSIVITGLITTMQPVFFQDSRGRRRVRSFTHETQPGEIGVYTWNNLRDGSFIYQSGTHPAVQVQMGLYGTAKLEADINTPYAGVNVDNEMDLFFSEIDPALHQAVANGTYGSTANPMVLSENFDTDAGSFSYADDTFQGTNQPGYADGGYTPTGGFAGGALNVLLGGIDATNILGMSGGWSAVFNLPASTDITISFRYNLTQSPNYESDEYSEALVAIDGTLYGSGGADYLARVAGNGEGGPQVTTGWRQFTVNLDAVAAGTHTLTIGGHNNKKTSAAENTEVLIDDVMITKETAVTMTSTIDYDPKYFLINGQPYSSAAISLPAGMSGETTLLRFYNASLQSHFPLIQNLYMTILSENGYKYTYPKQQYSLVLPAGTTKDATIAPSQDAIYSIYDRALNLTNAANQPGGMMTFLNVGNLNLPPVISSLSATPDIINYGGTTQLNAVASDPDSQPGPLTYNWTVTPNEGTFNDNTIPNPVYTPTTAITGSETYSIGLEVSDTAATVASAINITVQGVFLQESFDTDAAGFSYADDNFRATSHPAYASGDYIAVGGFTGGGLNVNLAGIDGMHILGMSGGWSAGFNLTSPSIATVSFRYNLTQSPNYESHEYSEVLIAVDGTLYGSGGTDYVARIAGDGEGGTAVTTGWNQFTVDLGLLSAGTHTLTIGAHNNAKTSSVESTEMFIDDVIVSP
jgi:hypothetical protein